jgi:hypothetical protein
VRARTQLAHAAEPQATQRCASAEELEPNKLFLFSRHGSHTIFFCVKKFLSHRKKGAATQNFRRASQKKTRENCPSRKLLSILVSHGGSIASRFFMQNFKLAKISTSVSVQFVFVFLYQIFVSAPNCTGGSYSSVQRGFPNTHKRVCLLVCVTVLASGDQFSASQFTTALLGSWLVCS